MLAGHRPSSSVVLKPTRAPPGFGLRPTRTSTPASSRTSGKRHHPLRRSDVGPAEAERAAYGGSPRVMTDVLKPGDVIYSRASRPTRSLASRAVVARAGAADQRCDRGHGSAHRTRARARRAASARRKPVRSRRAGARQPGSSFKPIIYTTALDNGYTRRASSSTVTIHRQDGHAEMVPELPRAVRGLDLAPRHSTLAILMTASVSNDMAVPII